MLKVANTFVGYLEILYFDLHDNFKALCATWHEDMIISDSGIVSNQLLFQIHFI